MFMALLTERGRSLNSISSSTGRSRLSSLCSCRASLDKWLPWRVLASIGPVIHSTHFFLGTIGYYGYYGTTNGYYTVPVGTTVLQGTMGTTVLQPDTM
jgi:hypothetical protein